MTEVQENDAARAARILARDRFEPPEECEHGFAPPQHCPNEQCADRAVLWAWYVGMYGASPPGVVLRDEDDKAVGT